MFHIIGHLVFGLVVGLVARLLMPGPDPVGLLMTCLLGVGGAWVGGQLGRLLGWYEAGHPAGFLMAVIGAIVLLVLYHAATRGPRSHTQRASVGSWQVTGMRANTSWVTLDFIQSRVVLSR